MWWLRSRLLTDQEFLADRSAALQLSGTSSGYAASLVSLAEPQTWSCRGTRDRKISAWSDLGHRSGLRGSVTPAISARADAALLPLSIRSARSAVVVLDLEDHAGHGHAYRGVPLHPLAGRVPPSNFQRQKPGVHRCNARLASISCHEFYRRAAHFLERRPWCVLRHARCPSSRVRTCGRGAIDSR